MEWPVFFKYRTKIKHLTLNWPCVELALHHPTHSRHFWFDRQFFVSSWIIRLLAVHRASRSIVEPCPRLQFPISPSNIEYRTLWTFQHACRRTIGVNQKDFLFRTYLNPPNTTLRHATNSIARIGEPSVRIPSLCNLQQRKEGHHWLTNMWIESSLISQLEVSHFARHDPSRNYATPHYFACIL